MKRQDIIFEVRPSWWNYAWLLVFGWLIFPLFIAIWQRYSELLRITKRQVILEKGILNKDFREIFISDIRAVDVEQTFWQRILGYGTVKFASAGTNGYELAAEGVPNPLKIKERVNRLRQKVRHTVD